MARSRGRHKSRYWQRDGGREPFSHNLDLVDYLDELSDLRAEAKNNLTAAGERALKVLDGFLADLARSFGLSDDRISMGDSIRHLGQLPGVPQEIASRADRYRDTRNAVFHNPDVMLRPEAAQRIIDGVEGIIRMAATDVRDLTRSSVVTTVHTELLGEARDRMLDHGYNQLVVVDDRGGAVDLLTDRDIVVMEARGDIDDGAGLSVGEAIATRGHLAVAVLPVHSSPEEAIDALRDEHIGAVVLTDSGRIGELPRGIITRGDVLKSL